MTLPTPTDDLIVQMVGVGKEFPGVKVLSDVNLGVRRGEILAICGENGSGKTTLMNILAGVHPYGTYTGKVLYNGYEMAFDDLKHAETAGIVIIHQDLALIPQLSLTENIFVGHERRKSKRQIDWKQTRAEAADLLARVGLNVNSQLTPQQIPRSKQQLVGIARALSKNVEVLIFDEPTAALGDADSAHLLDLIRQLKAQGITCIVISHKLPELIQVADRITVLRDGAIIDTLYPRSVEPITEDHIIASMVGRPMGQRFPEHAPNISGEALRVADWTVYDTNDAKRKVVDKVNISVRHGEIVGLAGLVGAGRTEFALSLFGHSYGRGISGRIFRDGREVFIKNVPDAIANGLAYATEDRREAGLNLVRSIHENVSAAALHKVASKRGIVSTHDEVATAKKYHQDFNIKTPHVGAQVGKLSGGNQQKVLLSKWVNSDADVLILDEPTRGVDVGSRYEIYGIINDLADAGKAIILISSDLLELIGTCDRIYTFKRGRVTADIPASEFSQELLMSYLM